MLAELMLVLASKFPSDIGQNLFQINPSFKQYSKQNRSEHRYEYKDNDYLVASAKIPAFGWNIWAWDSLERINAPSNQNLTYTLVLAITLMVISVSAIYLLVIRLMYVPIGGEPRDIERLLKKISQGDLASHPSYQGSDTGVYAELLKMVVNLRELFHR